MECRGHAAGVNSYWTANGWNNPAGIGQLAAKLRLNENMSISSSKGTDTKNITRNHVARSRAPGMVPIHVRLVVEIPRFSRQRGAHVDHVQPTARAISCHEFDGGIGITTLKQ